MFFCQFCLFVLNLLDSSGGYDNFAADTSTTKFDPQVTVENGTIEEGNQSQQEEKEDKDIDLIYDIVGLSYSQPDDQSRRMLEGLLEPLVLSQ